MSWRIECVVVGPIHCNCYILSDSISRKAYLIDPGAESKDLMSYLERSGLELLGMLITHGHIDHIGGIETVHAQFPTRVYYHAADKPLYDDIFVQAKLFGLLPAQLEAKQPKVQPTAVEHGNKLPLEGGVIEVVHTPGHTPGSICFRTVGEQEVVFTGDTLFDGSIGRTDLWGGSFEKIVQSIKERLMTLDDKILVLPGHGEYTTIGTERRFNPFLIG